MIAVIFEVVPKTEYRDAYMDLAAGLRQHLQQIDGFISVERFESLTERGKILSLSFWRDEISVEKWRAHGQHRDAQRAGRSQLFEHYRLRVATVMRDYGLHDRAESPADALD